MTTTYDQPQKFPTNPYLIFAVIVELLGDFVMAGIAFYRGDRVAIPGAAVRLCIMVLLGFLAIRGYEWARWIFVLLIGLTALASCFLAFFSLAANKVQFEFDAALLMLSLGYVVIAIAASMKTKKRTSLAL